VERNVPQKATGTPSWLQRSGHEGCKRASETASFLSTNYKTSLPPGCRKPTESLLRLAKWVNATQKGEDLTAEQRDSPRDLLGRCTGFYAALTLVTLS